MRPRGAAEATLVVLAATALTIVATYPVAFHLDQLGRINTDDGRWSIWVVSWVAHKLTTHPSEVFQANIFYPHRYALAFSEANLGAGLLGAPVWLATKNPYTTHNVVFLAAFVTALAGAYYLARYLTGQRPAAAVAAILFGFCPFIFARTAHVQLLFIGSLPFCMLAFHRLVDAPSVARSAVLGVLLWATAMTCAYYGIFAALMVSLGTLLYATSRRLWKSKEYWIGIALAAFTSLGLTIPFFLPYLYVQSEMGFVRTLNDAREYSANLGAWGASPAWAHRWWLPALGDFNETLFPGVLVTVLGVIGAVSVWRGGRPATTAPASRAPATAGPGLLPRDTALLYGARRDPRVLAVVRTGCGTLSCLLRSPPRVLVPAGAGPHRRAGHAVAHGVRRGGDRADPDARSADRGSSQRLSWSRRLPSCPSCRCRSFARSSRFHRCIRCWPRCRVAPLPSFPTGTSARTFRGMPTTC